PNGSGSNRDLLLFQRLDHGVARQLEFRLKQNDDFLDNASLNSWRLLTMDRLGPIAATNLIDIHRVEAILGLQTLEEVLAVGEISSLKTNLTEEDDDSCTPSFTTSFGEIFQSCMTEYLKGAAGEGWVKFNHFVYQKVLNSKMIEGDLLAEARFCSDVELTEKEIERMVMEASRAEYIANDKFKHQLGRRNLQHLKLNHRLLEASKPTHPLANGFKEWPSGSESKGKEGSVLCSMQMVLSIGFSMQLP
ncbi:hypothetical protein Tco_1366635, partial [Tanacetum coccineum]